jgi:hypothetical protein
MSYLKVIIPIIVIVIIAGAIALISEQETTVEKEPWVNESGPFSIEKHQYNLGEKIFIDVNNIPKNVKGEAIFFRPTTTPNLENIKEFEGVPEDFIKSKVKYLGIQFDGSMKDNFNRYFEPKFNEWKGICSANDLVGEWVIVFTGTDYEPMYFEIINQTSSWDDRTFEPLVNVGNC